MLEDTYCVENDILSDFHTVGILYLFPVLRDTQI